jgi:hypothetical protein
MALFQASYVIKKARSKNPNIFTTQFIFKALRYDGRKGGGGGLQNKQNLLELLNGPNTCFVPVTVSLTRNTYIGSWG